MTMQISANNFLRTDFLKTGVGNGLPPGRKTGRRENKTLATLRKFAQNFCENQIWNL